MTRELAGCFLFTFYVENPVDRARSAVLIRMERCQVLVLQAVGQWAIEFHRQGVAFASQSLAALTTIVSTVNRKKELKMKSLSTPDRRFRTFRTRKRPRTCRGLGVLPARSD
jgi:hypothetical protein